MLRHEAIRLETETALRAYEGLIHAYAEEHRHLARGVLALDETWTSPALETHIYWDRGLFGRWFHGTRHPEPFPWRLSTAHGITIITFPTLWIPMPAHLAAGPYTDLIGDPAP